MACNGKAKRLFQTLTNTIPAGVAVQAPDGSYLYVNEHAERLTGYSTHELAEGAEFLHPDEHEAYEIRARALRDGTAFRNYETRFLRKDGAIVWVSVSWQPVLDQDGKIEAVHAVFIDIGKRKSAEQALLRSESISRALLAAVPDLMFRIFRDGTFLDYLGAKDTLLYLPPSAFIGKNITEVLPKAIAEKGLRGIKTALATGETQVFEYQLRIDGADRDYEARIVASGEDEALAIIRDTTAHKDAERALQKAHAQLARAYELQREFLNNITHEVRTPLTAVQGYVQMLLECRAGPVNPEQAGLLKRVLASSEHMLEIMSGALEIARLKRGKLSLRVKACSPSAIVDGAVGHVLPQAKHKGLTIKTVHLNSNAFLALYDEEKITSILTNLLSNAVKFTQRGEIVVIVTCHDNKTEVIVSDPGMGIGGRNLAKIFDEFQQLDYPGKAKPAGFGIGLAIVAGMVEAIGAELIVSSKKGVGTAFTLEIPALQQ